MKVIKYILYKPYLFLICYLSVTLYLFASQNSFGKTLNGILLYSLYILLIGVLFSFLRNSLLRLPNRISFFEKVPDHVLSGYLFIFTLFNPLIAILLAVISKFFISTKIKQQSYIDEYGNEVTQIKSLTPTVILSRKEQGKEEHIVMTKLKKKPKKIIYE